MSAPDGREIIGYEQINVTTFSDIVDVYLDGAPIYAPEVTQDPWPEHYGTDRPTTVDEFVTALGAAKWRLMRVIVANEKHSDTTTARLLDDVRAVHEAADEIFCIADTLQDHLRQDKKAGD